jgi:outer membrane protein TolC
MQARPLLGAGMAASRALCAVPLLLLAGCALTDFYFDQTEGISPAKLAPLYFQEKQYVQDRTVEARVKGALAAEPMLRGAEIEVDAYKGEVTLMGKTALPEQAAKAAATAQKVFGVESVKTDLR